MSVSRVIPAEWLPPGRKVWRVVLHWSAGSRTPSAFDRAHYHCLINGEGQAVKGLVGAGYYAPHVRGLNTGSYGLSIAGMRGAREGGPYGDQPITALQYERAAQAAAEVLAAYDLALTPRTCLSHEEVTHVYGITQRGRWDVSELPWAPELSKAEVWALFRRKVEWYLEKHHGR